MDIERRREQWRQHHRLKKANSTPDELAAMKESRRLYDLEYRQKNAAKRKAYKADPVVKERQNAIRREKYRILKSRPREVLTEAQRRQRARESSRKYGRNNREKRLQYYRDNQARFLTQKSEYGKRNRATITARETIQKGLKRKTNPHYRAILNCYVRVNRMIKGAKVARTMELIGCTRDELMAHLEKGFTYGMCWDNYGRSGWHIDHILPLASFPDLTDPVQQRRAFHYTNLQPLWALENMSKGKKILTFPPS